MLNASTCPACGQSLPAPQCTPAARLLTPEEMAAELAIPLNRLMRAARAGRVPRIEVSARTIRFERASVFAALAKPARGRRRTSAKPGQPFDLAGWTESAKASAARLPAHG